MEREQLADLLATLAEQVRDGNVVLEGAIQWEPPRPGSGEDAYAMVLGASWTWTDGYVTAVRRVGLFRGKVHSG
jgi:hypothetical protein